LVWFWFAIAPVQQTRFDHFTSHMGYERGAQCGLMALKLRMVRVDVIRQQEPVHELRRMNRTVWRYQLGNVERLAAFNTPAETPDDASVVHQRVETGFAHGIDANAFGKSPPVGVGGNLIDLSGEKDGSGGACAELRGDEGECYS